MFVCLSLFSLLFIYFVYLYLEKSPSPFSLTSLGTLPYMEERVRPVQCAVLQNKVLLLDYDGSLHISTDLHSWTTTGAPYDARP